MKSPIETDLTAVLSVVSSAHLYPKSRTPFSPNGTRDEIRTKGSVEGETIILDFYNGTLTATVIDADNGLWNVPFNGSSPVYIGSSPVYIGSSA